MIHFVGAGPGAEDLITVRGQRLLREADVIIYAGSLVNPGLLKEAGEACRIYNSAVMTLEEVIAVMKQAEAEGLKTVRLHTGDPCLYGAIREQMDILDQLGISYESCPGVSSFCAAGGSIEPGIYIAGSIPERGDYQDGGKDAGSGERTDRILCIPWRDYGIILKYRTA